MKCPHCDEDTISTFKMYWWPFGIKTCDRCNGHSKMEKRPLLSIISFFIGGMAVIPPLVLDNVWYLIPSIIGSHILDYVMDKKYRVLVCITP